MHHLALTRPGQLGWQYWKGTGFNDKLENREVGKPVYQWRIVSIRRLLAVQRSDLLSPLAFS